MLAAGETGKLIAQFGDKTLAQPAAAADLKVALAGAHAAQGNADQARAALAAALRSVPTHTGAIVLRARLDAAEGDPALALRQLDEVLAREPGHAEAALVKGQIQLHFSKEPDAALATLRQVRNAHPKSVATLTAVLGILMQQNKRVQARTEFEQMLKAAPRQKTYPPNPGSNR